MLVAASPTPSPPRRVLIVTEFPAFSPATMVRALQYEPLFRADPELRMTHVTQRLYQVERAMRVLNRFTGWVLRRQLEWVTAWIQRRNENRIIRLAATYDIVYLVKVRSLRLHDEIRRLGRPRLVMDFGDALWIPSHQGWGWRGLDAMLRACHGVICEHEYVADYARKFNPNIFIVPDSPQIEVFDLWRNAITRDPSRIVLGWVGTGPNACCLYAIWEVLEELFIKYPQLHLRVVGADPSQCPRWEYVRCSYRRFYSQAEMAQEVLAMDIGLFPHFNVEDARARGAGKAMVYMAGEAVAVCQNVGENPKLIRDGVNGLLAGNHREWYEKLEKLITHPEERRRLAQAGLQTIRENFTGQKNYDRLRHALLHV